MKKFLYSFFVLLFIQNLGFSQSFYPTNRFKILNSENKVLINSFCGGLSNPMFSQMDVNADGLKDLVIFDILDNRKRVFLSKGFGSTDYQYASEYETLFPQNDDWFFLIDYNNDGLEDIVMSKLGDRQETQLWKNIGTATNPKFELILDPIKYKTRFSESFLPIVAPEFPAFADVDKDGDLDIIAFASAPNIYPRHYRNMSQELYGHNDSFYFWLVDECWGKFEETELSRDILLATPCEQFISTQSSTEESTSRAAHSGSTPTVLDLDGDGDMDLLLGDMEFPEITDVRNGKSQNNWPNDTMVSASYKTYPQSKPVNIPNKPMAFLVDVDNDGKKDLVFAPTEKTTPLFEEGRSAQEKFIWYFKNENTSKTHPIPVYKQDDFLENSMFKAGVRSIPVTIDINGDGLNDILVGSSGKSLSSFTGDRLVYLQNIGTDKIPEFKIIDEDYAALASMNFRNMSITKADLDGNGKMDLVLTKNTGELYWLKNNATGNMSVFSNTPIALEETLPSNLKEPIKIGFNPHPALFDIDSDGDLDLFVVDRLGKIIFYENSGTPTNYKFEKRTSNFGNLSFNFDINLAITSIQDTTYFVISGYEGKVSFYKNISLLNINQFPDPEYLIFDHGSQTKSNRFFGENTSVAFGDLDGDSAADLLMGSNTGGLYMFTQENYGTDSFALKEKSIAKQTQIEWKLFPNPNQGSFTLVSLNSNQSIQNYRIEIYSMEGKRIYSENVIASDFLSKEIKLPNRINGTFLVSISSIDKEFSTNLKLICY